MRNISYSIIISTLLFAVGNAASAGQTFIFTTTQPIVLRQTMPHKPAKAAPLVEDFTFTASAGIDPIVTGPNG
ncbi:hypothetical protein [Bartonella sp. LJL80]